VDVNEDVTLYGVIREPATQRNKNVALLLHPHPKLGGDANNNVVSALSRTLVEDVCWIARLRHGSDLCLRWFFNALTPLTGMEYFST
jgi:hypothetical protein